MMRQLSLWLLGFLSAAMCNCQVEAAEQRSDTEQLQGKWIVVCGKHDGKVSDELSKKKVFTFQGDHFLVTEGEIRHGDDPKAFFENMMRKGLLGSHTFELSGARSPKELDLITKERRSAKVNKIVDVKRAIYSLHGDVLILCLSADKQRPKEFKADKGDGRTLLIMMRATD